jgi:Tol biopolymer transport system component
MTAFDVSGDREKVVYCAADPQGKSYVWIASLLGRFSPRRLAPTENDRVFFGRDGTIIFHRSEAGHQFVFHMKEDGSQQEKLRSLGYSFRANTSGGKRKSDGRVCLSRRR